MLRLLSNKVKVKYVVVVLAVFVLLYIFGGLTFLFEKNYYSDFRYPYEGDLKDSVYQLRNGLAPDVKPINSYDYDFVHNGSNKCKEPEQQIQIVYIVKSDPNHTTRRSVIRSTWGFQKRFSDVEIRTVFILGHRTRGQKLIDDESEKYSDIIQANFTDSYYNNTIKTMMALKWAVTYCRDAKFYLVVDDDYYISTKNVLRFLRHPTNYPKYLEEAIFSLKNVVIKKRQVMDFELPPDVKLFSGYVFQTKPLRQLLNKWYVSLEEYPYNMWPPYVTGGATVLSREALLEMYYTSFYVKHFRFDDVYLGLVARRANIEPFHSDEIRYYKKAYSREAYKFVIASHGFDESFELLRVWNEQKSLGNA